MHRQSGNCALVDAEGPRNSGLYFALGESLDDLCALVGVQLWRTAKSHPTGLRATSAFTRSGAEANQ